MDNYVDHTTQSWNAEDVIRANAAAEAQEMERLRMQVAEYDERLKELRALNLKNLDLTSQIQDYVKQSQEKLASYAENQAAQNQAPGAGSLSAEALESLTRATAESSAKNHEEVMSQIHKEGVAVYRNLQAVVDTSSKSIQESVQNNRAKRGGIITLLILNLLVSGSVLAYIILHYFGIM